MNSSFHIVAASFSACAGAAWIAAILAKHIGYGKGASDGYRLGYDTGYVDCQLKAWSRMDRRFNHAVRVRKGAS